MLWGWLQWHANCIQWGVNATMKPFLSALKGETVELNFKGETEVRLGRIQAIRGDTVTVDDMFGGAYSFPASEVTRIDLNQALRPLIILANWQES